VPIKRHLQELP